MVVHDVCRAELPEKVLIVSFRCITTFKMENELRFHWYSIPIPIPQRLDLRIKEGQSEFSIVVSMPNNFVTLSLTIAGT